MFKELMITASCCMILAITALFGFYWLNPVNSHETHFVHN
jgi:hypothetical protein